jgi:hypothetical protein
MADVTDKIAKLLALAESTSNPHEAEAFTAKAEELMLQHGIEMAQVARKPGSKAEAIIIERIRVSGPFRMALSSYGHSVAFSFNCKGYKSVISKKEEDIWLVGHASDVEQAATLVRSLLVQADAAMKWWWRTEGKELNPPIDSMNQYKAKREFFFAFGSGVRQRLYEVRNRVVQEAAMGTELVLRDRTKQVEDWEKDNMSFSKTKGQSLAGGSYNAAMAGHKAGREAVGTKQVTN